MSEANPKPHCRLRLLKRLAVRIFVYLLLYVLSIGPMFWKWYAAWNFDQSDWLVAFYLPLLFACKIGFISNCVNWYINLWIL